MRNGTIQHQLAVTLVLPAMYFLLNSYGHVSIRSPIPSLSTIAWQITVCVLTDDFVFYWTHYLFHTRWLYKHIHKKHHIYKQPTGVVAGLSDPLESLFQSQLGIWGAIILFEDKHIFTICLWIFIRTYEGVSGHSGYDLPYISMHYYFPWLASSTLQHDYHHEHGKMNYGSFFTLWDRLLNTYRLPKRE
jgi:sterol desaturase/sphingolipid hydroxylase (fatty acid hydroxylase superfamily)